jgi:hypothetical protein
MQDMATIIHPWDLKPKEAIRLQRELASQVIDDVPLETVSTIAVDNGETIGAIVRTRDRVKPLFSQEPPRISRIINNQI